jgi:hypothetical protein
VDGLSASLRVDAWRLATADAEPSDSALATQLLGELAANDRYYIPNNDAVFSAFSASAAQSLGVDWLDPFPAELFLEDCRTVPTFVTRATFDLVNYSKGLVLALGESPGVAALTLDTGGPEERPGTLLLQFSDGTEARIRSPEYEAGHGVVGDQGQALVDDLVDWLGQVERSE